MSTHQNHLIPKKLYFTYKTETIPEQYQENVEKWRKICPDWEMHYFSDQEIFAFFETHFPEYLPDLKKVRNGVVLADLFRYAVLFIHGGMYTDLDTFPLSPPPDEWLNYQAVLGYEYRPSKYRCDSLCCPPIDSFCQWTLLSQKNHFLFKKTLDQSIQNFRKLGHHIQTNRDILESTGPLCFTSIVNQHLNDPDILILDMDAFASINLEHPKPKSCYVMHQNHGLSRWVAEKWLSHLNIE